MSRSQSSVELEWFSFSETFNGMKFYDTYRNAEFLKEKTNLRAILLKSDQLVEHYKTLEPGVNLAIRGMNLSPNVPLILKKSSLLDESDMDQEDFTLRRLLGMVAAYVHSNYDQSQWHKFYSIESERLGLTPPQTSANPSCNTGFGNFQPYKTNFKAYYSAISGAEYFFDHFNYNPFLFALRKFQLNQISEDLLLDIAKIRDNGTMKTLVMHCASDFPKASQTASGIGFSLSDVIRKAPQDIKDFFSKHVQHW